MAKKHYRAFKKQLEVTSPKGTFIPNNQKTKLVALSCIIVSLIFIKGILLGYIMGRKK